MFKPLSNIFLTCDNISWKSFDYSNDNAIIDLNTFNLPIMSNSNCKSINLIYIIYCNKCLYYYIGQTNNFRNRFNAHKRNILLSIIDENSLNDGFELYKQLS